MTTSCWSTTAHDSAASRRSPFGMRNQPTRHCSPRGSNANGSPHRRPPSMGSESLGTPPATGLRQPQGHHPTTRLPGAPRSTSNDAWTASEIPAPPTSNVGDTLRGSSCSAHGTKIRTFTSPGSFTRRDSNELRTRREVRGTDEEMALELSSAEPSPSSVFDGWGTAGPTEDASAASRPGR